MGVCRTEKLEKAAGRGKGNGTGIEDILCVFTPEPHYKNQNLHFQSSIIKDWPDQFVSRSDKQMQCVCTKRSQCLTEVTKKKARSRRD